MNTFLFVSVICIGQSCGFMTSPYFISEAVCQEYKEEFTQQKFKPEVTLAAYQCMKFKPETKV